MSPSTSPWVELLSSSLSQEGHGTRTWPHISEATGVASANRPPLREDYGVQNEHCVVQVQTVLHDPPTLGPAAATASTQESSRFWSVSRLRDSFFPAPFFFTAPPIRGRISAVMEVYLSKPLSPRAHPSLHSEPPKGSTWTSAGTSIYEPTLPREN